MTGRQPLDSASDAALTAMLERMPPTLYKYTGLGGPRLEWMKSLILDSQLYFPSPRDFNDPLDCRIPPSFEGSSLLVGNYWQKATREGFPQLPAADRRREVKKMTLESKTPDGQARLTEKLFTSLDKHGVACLSKDPTTMLLWSYYADGHSGIAVQFNMAKKNLYVLGRMMRYFAVEVQYRSDFPGFSYFKSSDISFIHNIVGTKGQILGA